MNLFLSFRLIKRYKLPLLLIILTLILSCKEQVDNNPDKNTQEALNIPSGRGIVVNGIIGDDEWTDAKKLEIVLAQRTVEIWIKHDSKNLLVLFNLHNPDVSNVVFPELVFDPNNDKSNGWLDDDWWFHVSGTDCVSQGRHGTYTNCEVEQPDWLAVPNYAIGTPSNVSIIEISIPFSKVGITTSRPFGMALLVTNMNTLLKFWPSTASLNKPGSWCEATIVN